MDKLNYYASAYGVAIEVGSYPPGANGLYDMAGNVWEWTSSQFQDYPYAADDGREEPGDDARRTLRGGSFDNLGSYVRCAGRSANHPSIGYDGIGFRVVVGWSPGF